MTLVLLMMTMMSDQSAFIACSRASFPAWIREFEMLWPGANRLVVFDSPLQIKNGQLKPKHENNLKTLRTHLKEGKFVVGTHELFYHL